MFDEAVILRKSETVQILYRGTILANPEEDFDQILTQIMAEIKNEAVGVQAILFIRNIYYFYHIYNYFILLLSYKNPDEQESIIWAGNQIGNAFIQKHADDLKTFSGNMEPFLSFSDEIQKTIDRYMKQLTTLKKPKKGVDLTSHAAVTDANQKGRTDLKTYVSIGQELLKKAKFKEAQQSFMKALEYDPKNLEAHIGIIVADVKLEAWNIAYEKCQVALDLFSQSEDLWALMARICGKLEKLKESRISYRRVLELNPKRQGINQIIEDLDKKIKRADTERKKKFGPKKPTESPQQTTPAATAFIDTPKQEVSAPVQADDASQTAPSESASAKKSDTPPPFASTPELPPDLFIANEYSSDTEPEDLDVVNSEKPKPKTEEKK